LSLDLNQALARLSPGKRLCVVLAYLEGLSHPEIAKLSDLPLGTVKSHIRRGTQELKQLLDSYSEDNVS
jgi:RNA polymerase sigma-70 factor (ECF subfamily)